ncbi:MAG TPA: hypothetical protein VG248_04995 [Caulobacteraceae bacterium]|jgi:hypothetical protein|nr:hypothetical protein [Caulobacteraceae bacterium]
MDTNALIEAHRVGAWRALSRGYGLETVETCLAELGTGHRAPPTDVLKATRADLAAVHEVAPAQRAMLALREGPALDEGERDLWAHALTRADGWVLCGPDTASMRWGFENGFRDRLVSFGRMVNDIGLRPRIPLRPQFEPAWLDEVMRKCALGIL